ncbi:MAG: sigma-70 family RNA polymerase sigma factor [Ramlibacter sp.]
MERITRDSRLANIENRLKQEMLRGLAGDGVAYHEFLKELSAFVRGFLGKRLLGLPDEVEDLVQETLLAVHNHRHTFRPDQPLTAWVHAIARHKLVDMLRARASREGLNDPLDDELAIFAVSDTDAADARRDLGKLLSALPDRQRLAILHVKVQGFSVMETAQMTGMSESAVKVGVHRGLKALAAKIKESL